MEVKALNVDLATPLTLVGSAIAPDFAVDKEGLKFRPCYIGETTEATLSVTNLSQQLPLSFSFEHLAHFSVSPVEGLLLPHATTQITVSFTPQQMGRLRKTMSLALAASTVIWPLKIQGEGLMAKFEDMVARTRDRATGERELKTIAPARLQDQP
jgi:hypothetical protein